MDRKIALVTGAGYGVAPGNIRTGIVERASPEMRALDEQMRPAKRYGTTREIAEAVAWLASDAARGGTAICSLPMLARQLPDLGRRHA